MRNELYSLTYCADFGEDGAKPNARLISIHELQRDNALLRTIVAELLLKNQILRWELGGQRSLDALHLSPKDPARKG